MPQPPSPQPLTAPPGSITVTLTAEQWQLLQQLLHSGPSHVQLPFSSGTISFDIFPLTVTAIPPGTDLTQHQLYQAADGVTFAAEPGPSPGQGGVYTVADPSGRSRNVVSLLAPPYIPWFDDRTGKIKATFNPPVRAVAIDAMPTLTPEGFGATNDQPVLEAFNGAGSSLGQVLYASGASPWGTWQTLTITHTQADIASVTFSVQSNQPGRHAYAIFDNLHYQR